MDKAKGKPPMSRETMRATQCSESGLRSQRCLNPLCDKPVEPKRKHAPVKHYCSGECVQTVSILRRAAKLLGVSSGEELASIVRGAR